MRTIRRTLAESGVAVGSWVNTASPVVAEIMASTGFDFLTVDAEHSAVDLPGAQALFQAIRSGGAECVPLVRLPGVDYAEARRYMDAGAAGLIAPLVNSPDQARELVDAVKYPPQGRRGVGFCRDNMYGASLEETVASANDRTLVCVQIEHVDGVERVDEILSVEGVDAVFVGPYDLTASMGITARFDHPDYRAACDRVLAAAKSHGVAPGIHVVNPDPEEAVARVREGYRLVAYSLDITMLLTACQSGLKAVREGIGARRA